MPSTTLDSRREWIRSVVDTYEGRLIRYAASLMGSADAARDVVQETFLCLCRERAPLPPDHVPGWLYRVCRNRAIDAHRKEGRMVSLEQTLARSPDVEPIAGDPALSPEERAALERILAWLPKLPSSQQVVLRLRFQEELSYKEIGAATGQTVNHVGVLIHQGLKRLRRVLAEGAAAGQGRGV